MCHHPIIYLFVDSNRILVSVLLTGSVRRVSERHTLGIVLTESSVEIILAHTAAFIELKKQKKNRATDLGLYHNTSTKNKQRTRSFRGRVFFW